MIAAVAENNALGKNNEMVWHLPNDLKFFKNIKNGHHRSEAIKQIIKYKFKTSPSP